MIIIDYYNILHNLLNKATFRKDELTYKESKHMNKLYEWFENDDSMSK